MAAVVDVIAVEVDPAAPSGGLRYEVPVAARRAVSVMIGFVVGLTFLFGFGNVLDLGCGSACRRGWRPSLRRPWTSRWSRCCWVAASWL
jgi:hypothetical protein